MHVSFGAKSSGSVLPKFFGTGDQFHKRQFFHTQGEGQEAGFRMIPCITFNVRFLFLNLMPLLTRQEVPVHGPVLGTLLWVVWEAPLDLQF